MNSSIIIIAVLTICLVGLLMLRLRLRCQIGKGQRQLFVGLGRSGIDFDWKEGKGFIQLFGLRVKEISLGRKLAKDKTDTMEDSDKKDSSEIKEKKEQKEKASRVWPPLKELGSLLASSVKPIWGWSVSLLKATKIEELDGSFRGGFESPDLTGQAYGYYQAMIGAVPALSQRIHYEPIWTEAGLEAELTGSVALPLYSLVGRTIQLGWALPLRKIIKLAIGRNKPKR